MGHQMNELGSKDLKRYWRIFMWVAVVFFLLKIIAIFLSFMAKSQVFLPLLGSLGGSITATANLFALAITYYFLVMKNSGKIWLLLPVATFLLMCVLAYIYAIFFPEQVIGFALGLSVPIIFAGAIISFDKPLLKA